MAIETIPALFLHAVKTHKRKDAFRYKKSGRYVDISHDRTMDMVDKASLGITALGLVKGDRIALLSENRFEWVVADLAILSAGCINVPVYPTLPSGHIEYILKDSEARAIFVSNTEQLEKIQAIRGDLPNLKHVIVLEAEGAGDDAVSLDDLVAKGAAQSGSPDYESRISTIGKYDWASILYTSGTTGSPKGVILNQWNFVSNVTAVLDVLSLGNTDSCLSFLPLSHVFERTGGYYAMMLGGASIAYAESIDTVAQNLQEVHPTILVSVPRLYEKMYGRILDAVTGGSGLKKQLFFWAIGVGRVYVRQKLENRISPLVKMQYKLAMALVLKKLKGRTGGRLRFFVSGGAPLAREIAEFFYAAGLPILEGYGLTETSPVITLNTFDHFKFGTVGRPVPGVEVRIAEDGEICTRGPNIMLGYYKKPDLTSEVMKDGWFYTGDIGYLDEKGFLTITDRKKDIIVTAGGKNIAPQPIENLLKTSKYIDQVVLIGDKRKFISALVVPNFENLHAFADAAGVPYQSNSDLIEHKKVFEKIRDELEEKSQHLAGFERIKKFILVEKDFTVEGGELTPTLKVKRKVVENKFQKAIDALYSE